MGQLSMGERLKQARELRGMTRIKLGMLARLAPMTIYQLERGRFRPRDSTLDRLTKALDVHAIWLLEGRSDLAPRETPTIPDFPANLPLALVRILMEAVSLQPELLPIADHELDQIVQKYRRGEARTASRLALELTGIRLVQNATVESLRAFDIALARVREEEAPAIEASSALEGDQGAPADQAQTHST